MEQKELNKKFGKLLIELLEQYHNERITTRQVNLSKKVKEEGRHVIIDEVKYYHEGFVKDLFDIND